MKITVNNIPGKVTLFNNVGTQYHATNKDYWIGSIMYAVENMDEEKRIFFEDPVVIIIKINFKDVIWDVDNHFVGMVINGIRYSGLIGDDNFKKVKYFIMGNIAEKENYNTEIYIVKDSDFTKLYNIIRYNKIETHRNII